MVSTGIQNPCAVGPETLNAVLEVVAHLKTLFSFPVASRFKQKTRKQLIKAAKAYARLLDVVFVLESDAFTQRSQYIIRFFPTNFLHLSGVETKLASRVFFENCLSGKIDYQEFWDSKRKNKNTIQKKLRNLVNIDSVFEGEIFVQEDFAKNTIHCIIATTDGQYTLGFVDNELYAVPNTILDKNHLDPNKPIYKIKAKVK